MQVTSYGRLRPGENRGTTFVSVIGHADLLVSIILMDINIFSESIMEFLQSKHVFKLLLHIPPSRRFFSRDAKM